MQQAVGNRQVQRWLQGPSGSHDERTPVQRVPDPAPEPGALNPQEQAFLNRTVEAGSVVAAASQAFSIWLGRMAIAYAQAWSSHRNALQSASVAAKDANNLVLGLVLAGIPGGIGGAAGRAMQNLGAGAPMVDGVKDLVKYGLRTAGAAGVGALPSTPATSRGDGLLGGSPTGGGVGAAARGSGFEALPPDPLVWQNHTGVRAREEVLLPTQRAIISWQRSLNSHDAQFVADFDPVEVTRRALTLDGASLEALPSPPGNLQTRFEQGFLIDWIQSVVGLGEARSETSTARPAGGLGSTYSPFAWGKVGDRLEAYGQRIGLPDVGRRLNEANAAWTDENNRRAVRGGHGLI